ncbi:MAG: transcriptional repressor MprA, partial [Hafnia sp.]
STLSADEQQQLETLTRKLLGRIEEMEQSGLTQ